MEQEQEKRYYTDPSNEVFEEVKKACIAIWKSYDDSYGYASEKIERVNNIENYKDNMMYMISMFDQENIYKLSEMLSIEASLEVGERLDSVEHDAALLFLLF